MTQEEQKALERATRYAKSVYTTPEEHDDIMTVVRLAGSLTTAFAIQEAELTTLRARLAEVEGERDAARSHVKVLIQLAIDGGLTHDLMVQLYPDSKKPNGQPADEFAKRAQRAINEARAALTGAER